VAKLQFNRKRREDPVYLMWEETQGWLAAYGRILAVVVAVIVVVGVVGNFWLNSRAAKESEAGVKLAEAKQLYWAGDYASVIQRTQEVEDQYRGTKAGVDAIRVRADAFFWQGDFPSAIGAYELYLDEVKVDTPVLSGVRENLAQAHESQGQFEQAAQIYEEAAGELGPRNIQAERIVDAAYAWKEAGNSDRAIELFRRVTAEYADTPSYPRAEIGLGEMGLQDS
jgi:tetratricopeptide (TPR) repeat protein